MKVPIYYWLSVVLLAIILSISNFLLTNLLSFMPMGLAAWFAILIFAFSCGILLLQLFGLKYSIWILGLSWFAISFFSFVVVAAKPGLFYINEFSGHAILNQIMKITFTTVFVFFGIIFFQVVKLTKEIIKANEKISFYEKHLLDAKHEAELLKREALINANEIVFDAKKKVQELEKRKEELEIKVREFINAELAVLEKHEKTLEE
ncbi:MAG: hypothetical protein N3A61_09800 [Ignavibacteria bacterium]|nr:hypothetical protein [Ignavibacteria bacterium]